jgi:hypothetical protein
MTQIIRPAHIVLAFDSKAAIILKRWRECTDLSFRELGL